VITRLLNRGAVRPLRDASFGFPSVILVRTARPISRLGRVRRKTVTDSANKSDSVREQDNAEVASHTSQRVSFEFQVSNFRNPPSNRPLVPHIAVTKSLF
jgi:hypothetical protein